MLNIVALYVLAGTNTSYRYRSVSHKPETACGHRGRATRLRLPVVIEVGPHA